MVCCELSTASTGSSWNVCLGTRTGGVSRALLKGCPKDLSAAAKVG